MSRKQIIIFIIVIVVFAIVFPIVLEFLFFKNNFNSEISNSDWSSFFGSFIGGIIGGIGTLLAVYITTKETRDIQNKTNSEIEKDRTMQEKNNRQDFSNDIAKLVAKFSADISNYFYSYRNYNELMKEFDCCMEKESRLIKEINKHNDDIFNNKRETDVKLGELNKELNKVRREMHEIKYKIQANPVNRIIAVECLNLLKIKLHEISEARKLINQVEYIHNNSMIEEKTEWIEKQIEILFKYTNEFIFEYVNKII